MPDLTLTDISEEQIRLWANSANAPLTLSTAARKWLRDNEPPPPPEREMFKLPVITSSGDLRLGHEDGPTAVRARDLQRGDRIEGHTVKYVEIDRLNRALVRTVFEDTAVLFYTCGTLVLLDA